MRRTLLAGTLVALCAIGSIAAPAPLPDLTGVYRCDGTNPDGKPYHGLVEIRKVRETFRVRWTMDDGAITGVGIYSSGVFAVSYFGGAPAVVVYTVDGEKLVGEWTMGGAEGAVYSETLIRTGAAPAQEPGRQEREPRALPRDHPSVPSEPTRGGIRL
ncbi:MAG: hypothetical protein A3F70_16210 [Acidobacteria bacterium RIFCSPLOWO2_12_FULL_67_14]|nr:MAG: hypothetical protein A3H29_06885 [Acidobacteria bacterium RIFCSPLOWO2_02_FULL_67_21]OFW35443.1 MAG: hypothetical protein A3F70_16210 [Acidobacteria bacterium RIFCSPLOWO2_12_FULL_67_14]